MSSVSFTRIGPSINFRAMGFSAIIVLRFSIFRASYYRSRADCPSGCCPSGGSTCSSCDFFAYRVLNPVTLSGAPTAKCPCLPHFYEDADLTCKQCTSSLYCETCYLDVCSNTGRGTVKCLTCNGAMHRELINGNCVCKSGYKEPTLAGPYCERV